MLRRQCRGDSLAEHPASGRALVETMMARAKFSFCTASVRSSVVALVLLGVAVVGLPARAVRASEMTDVLDAFDPDNPYDLSLRVRFLSETRNASIGREYKCIKNDQIGASACKGGSAIQIARELEYHQVRNQIAIDARVGLYRDVEGYATFPVVLSDQWQHKFAAGVSQANSTIMPLNKSESLFAVPYNSTERSGFGDMHLGFKWAPYNYQRDHLSPTWVLGIDWMLPTGSIMKASNTSVGLGLHELKFYTTISKRVAQIIEPFIHLHGNLRFAASDSLFVSHGETQVRTTPGDIIGTQFGATFLPWENIKKDERFEIEGGFGMEYIFRGREYSDIWEALASAKNPCNAANGCTNTLHSLSAPDPITGRITGTDGITDVEPYGRFTGWAAMHYQPVKYFQVSAKMGWMSETPHYLTFGEYGRDLDGGVGGVQQSNSRGENEYSPTYLPAVDAPGSRLRLTAADNFALMFSISGKL